MSTVLDASALISFRRDEPGAEVVQNVRSPTLTCYVHALNLCGVYYDFWREAGRIKAVYRRVVAG